MDLKQLHYDVMRGKTDYVPLMVNIHREDAKWTSTWDAAFNPQKYLDETVHRRALDIKFPTDRAIVLESNFQETIIPCMFGAVPHEMPGGNIDVYAIFNSLDEAEAVDINYEPLYKAAEHVKYLKTNAPCDVNVAITRFMAPLDYAVVMRSGDFYLDLCLEPEKSLRFLNRITDLTLHSIKYLKEAVGEDYREHITPGSRGIYIRGTRLSGDAYVNLSPQMIADITLPLFKRFNDELGGVFVHYCTQPAAAGHVLATLAKNPGIIDGVDNWQGPDTFFGEARDVLQDKISMCFDLDYDTVWDVEGLMKRPLFKDVKRSGGRGIFVGTNVYDIEKAKRLYERWQGYFGV